MRGVTQRVEGWPFGECVAATYATILGCDIDDVPRFDPAAIGSEDQGKLEREWLASLGIDLVEISVPPDQELAPEVCDLIADEWGDEPHLISGISPRGFGHRCVGIGGQVAWDPHPSRAGLVRVYSVGLLVPMEKI